MVVSSSPEKVTEKGVVLQMQDYSIHDGDGVRTTIFLAGCGLRCQWCANPETWTKQPKLAFYEHKCKGCLSCMAACPKGLDPRSVDQQNEVCDQCGLCVRACPSKALASACHEVTVDEVYQKIQQDELFFRYTDGGVTFSGGEPFLQHQFIRDVMDRAEPLGVSFWAETCGFFSWSQVKDLIPRFEHIFFDLKVMDPDAHKRYTGVDNAQILRNVCNIYALGVPLTIRIPFIPQVNGHEENIRQTALFMSEHLQGCNVELLPYHELGKAKYTAFKMLDSFQTFTVPTQDELARAYTIFAEYGVAAVQV